MAHLLLNFYIIYSLSLRSTGQLKQNNKHTVIILCAACHFQHSHIINALMFVSGKPKQAALKFAFKKYNRRYITFNFKGKGNAQLQFFISDRSKKFQVHTCIM